jgi:hypothetical protein
MPRDPKKELLFRKFGYWQVIGFADCTQGSRWWWCVCQCQRSKNHPTRHRKREDHLRAGRTKSCGCYRSSLMQGNRRANKATDSNITELTNPSPERLLHSWQGVSGGTNLIGEDNSLPKCPHGVYLAKADKALYCQFCNPTDQVGKGSGSLAWNRRLAEENLRLDRGTALSTTEDQLISTKARKFTKTADKVWAGGKNLILAGGGTEVDVLGGIRETRWRSGGKKRSAAGRDTIKPWQNPNVDGPQDEAIGESFEQIRHRDTQQNRPPDMKLPFENPDAVPDDLEADDKTEFKRLLRLDREKEESEADAELEAQEDLV